MVPRDQSDPAILSRACREMKKLFLCILIAVAGFGTGYEIKDMAYSKGPVQPIDFSHKIHAGDNQIPCQYCHIYAERARVSGAPTVQKCMGCHKVIKHDSPLIEKVTSYFQKKEPIPWVRVQALPDFVYFPHKRHLKAGLECTNCHGNVASMAKVTPPVSFKMGWCIDCHTRRGVENGKDCWTCHQ